MKRALKHWRDTSPLMEPVCRIMRGTGLVPETVWRHLAFSGTIDFRIAGRRVRMRHLATEVENSLFWAGYGSHWEGTSLLVWERLAAESSTIFDVGANTGIYALAAKAATPDSRVHAFEPIPVIADRLTENVRLNGFDITCHAVAVSDTDGEAQIRLMEGDHQYSASLEHMEWQDTAQAITLRVPLRTLASVIAETEHCPDLIKLDVERHEPQALRGLWPGVDNGPMPTMLVEILDDESAAAVGTELAGRGYRCFVVREGQEIREAPLCFEPGTMNWLFVPETAIGFAARLREAGGISHAELTAQRPGRV